MHNTGSSASRDPSPMDVDPHLPDASSAPTFRFLDLPTELRLQVYAHLLVDPGCYILPIANIKPVRPNKSKKLCPAILQTCSLVHGEASAVLYGGNIWMVRTFPLNRCVPELLAYIGAANARLIRRVFCTGLKGCTLDQEKIRERYVAMGIQWEKLRLWAIRSSLLQDVERWAREEEWVERVDERRMKSLGLSSEWWDFGEGLEGFWTVKKGCKGSDQW